MVTGDNELDQAPVLLVGISPTGGIQRLPTTAADPIWSPTGDQIAYSTFRWSRRLSPEFAIRTISPRSGARRVLVYAHGYRPTLTDWTSRWGIVMNRVTNKEQDRAWLLSPHGWLHRAATSVRAGQWSPHGTRLVFDKAGSQAIACPDGRQYRQITKPHGGTNVAAWSPDGRSIALNVNGYRRFDVALVPAGTKQPLGARQWDTVIVNGEALDWQPLLPEPPRPAQAPRLCGTQNAG